MKYLGLGQWRIGKSECAKENLLFCRMEYFGVEMGRERVETFFCICFIEKNPMRCFVYFVSGSGRGEAVLLSIGGARFSFLIFWINCFGF
jgi:hypothetical protein